jgi:hypothetical protein
VNAVTIKRRGFNLPPMDLGESPTLEDFDTLRRERVAFGFNDVGAPILAPGSYNSKLARSGLCWSCSLLPARLSGVNLCPSSTPECRRHCLNLAGKGGLDTVQRGRGWRASLLVHHPEAFGRLLAEELRDIRRRTGRLSWGLRLNVLQDVDWRPWSDQLEEAAGPRCRAWDYTKRPETLGDSWRHVVYSASRERETVDSVRDIVNAGHSVAVVASDLRKKDETPRFVWGLPAVDGDLSDRRDLDRFTGPRGGRRSAGVVVLRPKGSLRLGAGTSKFCWAVTS